PLQQARPVLSSNQYYRKRLYTPGLDESQRLEDLIQGSKPARHADISLGVFDKHHLADEKVLEIELQCGIRIRALFERQLNIEPYRFSSSFLCALVPGFHHPRPPAGNDMVSVLGKFFGDLICFFINLFTGLHSS